jgi:hypothetical protein
VTDVFRALQAALAGRYALELRQDGSPPLLGRGGMAEVYLATDLRHHRQVALKALHPVVAQAIGMKRFLQEIEIDARLSHPNILPLLEAGSIDRPDAAPLLWFAMPHVAGGTLRSRLDREGQLPIPVALHIARQVADALAHAHRHEIIHRDIKPENILLDGDEVFLSDFGIAKAVSIGSEGITSYDRAVGTVAYMSPEQAEGSGAKRLDGRSDIYSLGCVLHEMLSGEPPFTGPSSQAVLARHKLEPPPSIRIVRPSVPRGLEKLVHRSLAKVPADRFASAADFAQALSHPVEFWERQDRFRPSRRAAWSLAASGAALLGMLGLFWSRGDSTPADLNRILILGVDPVSWGAADSGRATGATEALLSTVSSTGSLAAIDGRRLDPGASDRTRAGQVQAGYYVRTVLHSSDSTRVRLELHDLIRDTVLDRTLAFDSAANGWEIGFHAAQQLIPLLFPAARGPDFPLLTTARPEALAEFFQAEQHYRESSFDEALGHYSHAVGVDSGFALAALRGAQTATWTEQRDQARPLLRIALLRLTDLPPRFQRLARALDAYLDGRADTAVAILREALSADGESPETWMLLGETYNHLLPAAGPLDSLAEDAFRRTRQLDSAFSPVLFHLIEFAARRGDTVGGAQALHRLQGAHPDSIELGSAKLMLRCATQPLTEEQWHRAVERSPDEVRIAAQSLSVAGLRQVACARSGWAALLAYDVDATDPASMNRLFYSRVALQHLLVAQGRADEVRALWGADTLFNRGFRDQMLVLDALATGRFAAEADRFAARHFDELAAGDTVVSHDLWLAGSWTARQGRAGPGLRAAAETLAVRARRGGRRFDSLLARSLAAQQSLALGDTVLALEQLRAMTPTASETALIAWNPWESLGYERLLITEILVRQRKYPEAIQVAAGFDAPGPLVYAIYLPAALRLRLQAAEQWQEQSLARECRRRLVALEKRPA